MKKLNKQKYKTKSKVKRVVKTHKKLRIKVSKPATTIVRKKPHKKEFRTLKFGLVLTIPTLLIFIGSVLLVRFNTAIAAELTDDFLRPILGNEPVIFLEKIYFNTADKLTQLAGTKGSSPSVSENDKFAPPVSGDLRLNQIAVNPRLIALPNEGVWFERKISTFPDKQVLAYTFVRPDEERPYANVTLIQADMGPLLLGTVAGIKQPGGPVGNPGTGVIPKDIIKTGNLVAAFDGGFQYRDGMYGMIVGDKTYLPLKQDIGTLVGYKNGSFQIIKYTGQDLGQNVSYIRQNCPILIENSDLAVTNPINHDLWGRTVTSDIYTWRSGVGITKEGNLLFAIGNNINPTTLAQALKMGGATDAIQLDINPFWVRFSVFNYLGEGKYDSAVLMKGVYNGAKEFLEGYEKDFFFLYKKTI